MNTLPETLTVFEVARILHVTPRTVRAMVRRGEIPRLDPVAGSRRQYVIPRSAIERLLPKGESNGG